MQPAEPSDSHSGKVDFDGQDNSPDTPAHQDDQPTSSDEPVELTSTTDGNQYRQISTDIEQASPRSGRSKETPFEPPEDTFRKVDPHSTQPAEDHKHVQRSSANMGTDSGKESIDGQLGEDAEPPPPRRFGGRRDHHPASAQQPPEDDAEAKRQFTPRPELICRQERSSWQWEVVLSADDECNIEEMQHDGGESWGILNGECHLSSLAGSLSITLEDGERSELTLFNGTPMVFKSRSDWRGDGRKVRAITGGFYVVIVPKEWKRTGPVPREPEGCADQGFLAHFFRTDGKSAGDVGGFEKCEVALAQSGLELTGDRVFDDSEDGELFVGAVPKLNPVQGTVWARVGEEKGGGWQGDNFKPVERSLADVLNGRQGRFFIRVYDDDSKLLDSGEFRYLRDLREIRVNGKPYSANTLLAPSSTGHSPTELRFIGADGTTIHPVLTADETHATVQPGDVLVVAPHAKCDDVSRTLTSGTGRVDTVIKLPRIWWRMERDDGEPDEYRDTPLTMTRKEYREYAYAEAATLLRLPPQITSVKAGFDEKLDRMYRPPKSREETKIPLSDFVDYSQLDERPYEDASLNVQCAEAVLTLIRISANPAPTIISFASEPTGVAAGEAATLHWVTQNPESDGVVIDPGIGSVESSGNMAVAPAETATYTLRLTASGMDDVTKDLVLTVHSRPQPGEEPVARVKHTGRGWRQGKGFSRGEIHAAGLTEADVACRSISIDRRRRSTHQANIETIRRSIDA